MPAELEHVPDTAASPESTQVETSPEHNNGHAAVENVDKEITVSKELTIAIVGAVSAISVAAVSMGILFYFLVYKRAGKNAKYFTIKSSFSIGGQSTFRAGGSEQRGMVSRNPAPSALPVLLLSACLSSLCHAGVFNSKLPSTTVLTCDMRLFL